jgi:co-chaperonin GroES (HSP10)
MTEGMEIIHDYSPEDFEPHGDAVVLFRDDDVEKTEAGIIFPNNKVRWTGRIHRMGDGKRCKELQENGLMDVGDRVVVWPEKYYTVADDPKYLLMNVNKVLGRVEKAS